MFCVRVFVFVFVFVFVCVCVFVSVCVCVFAVFLCSGLIIILDSQHRCTYVYVRT